MAGAAQAVQPSEVSLSQLAALLSSVGVTCVYLMTTISLSYKLPQFHRGREGARVTGGQFSPFN